MAGLVSLCACTATVTGSGSLSGTAGRTPTPSRSTVDVPRYQAPDTAIGNPRTVDLCSAISFDRFDRYGRVGPALPVTPEDCWFYVTPPGAKSDVRMSAFVYGLSPYDANNTDIRIRNVAGQSVYFYPFADRYCRAMIAGLQVAIGIEADDQSGRQSQAQLCAMRDTLVTQLSTAVTAHRLRHRVYGSNSLTAVDVCDQLDSGALDIPDAKDLELRERQYGEGCELDNAAYSIEVWVGLRPPPVVPGPGGKRLNLGGHAIVQPAKADPDYCAIVAQQDLVPGSGADYTETIEASAQPNTGSGTGGSGAVSGEALCTQIAGAVLLQFLRATGRI
jgi:hypothetical protein